MTFVAQQRLKLVGKVHAMRGVSLLVVVFTLLGGLTAAQAKEPATPPGWKHFPGHGNAEFPIAVWLQSPR